MSDPSEYSTVYNGYLYKML